MRMIHALALAAALWAGAAAAASPPPPAPPAAPDPSDVSGPAGKMRVFYETMFKAIAAQQDFDWIDDIPTLFVPEIAERYKKASADPEAMLIDFDWFLNAQDYDKPKLLSVEADTQGAVSNVTVTFEDFGEKRVTIFKMADIKGVWLIADITWVGPDGDKSSTLVGSIMKDWP